MNGRSSRADLDDRAERILDDLSSHFGIGDNYETLLRHTRLENSSRTRAAIRHARNLARDRGMCLPPAIAETGFVYMLTDSAFDILDPAYHMGAISRGTKRRERELNRHVLEKSPDLSPTERQVIVAREALEEEIHNLEDRIHDYERAQHDARQEDRRRSRDGQPG